MLVVAEHVGARVELDLAGAIAEVDERRLAVAAPRHHPAGDEVARLGLLAVAEPLVRGAHVGDRLAARVAGRIGLEALRRAVARASPRRSAISADSSSGAAGCCRLRRSSGARGYSMRRRSVAAFRMSEADRDPGRDRRRPAADLRDLQPRGRGRDRHLRPRAAAGRSATTTGSPIASRSIPCSSPRSTARWSAGRRSSAWSPRGAYRRTARGLRVRRRRSPRPRHRHGAAAGADRARPRRPRSRSSWRGSRCRTRPASRCTKPLGFRSFGTQRRVRREARPGPRRRAHGPAPGPVRPGPTRSRAGPRRLRSS